VKRGNTKVANDVRYLQIVKFSGLLNWPTGKWLPSNVYLPGDTAQETWMCKKSTARTSVPRISRTLPLGNRSTEMPLMCAMQWLGRKTSFAWDC